MKVLVVSTTPVGRTLAESLPYEHVHESLPSALARHWNRVDVLVCVADAPAVVRAAAPLLSPGAGPGLVCVDEAGTWAVPLIDGANPVAAAVAIDVADRLDADAVLTDRGPSPWPEPLAGFTARGDVDGLTSALVAGETVVAEVAPDLGDWPLPPAVASLERASTAGRKVSWKVHVTDADVLPAADTVVLHPQSLVAGVGLRTSAPARDVASAVAGALADAGLAPASVAEVATADRHAGDLAVLALGLPVRAFTRDRLLGVKAPARVAEAAARRAAGRRAVVVARPKAGPEGDVAVAIARRAHPRGHLALVGLGPGDPEHRTGAAADAVIAADVIIASGPDLEQVRDLLRRYHEVVERLPGDEHARVRQALAEADRGRRVALLCSGDAGIYALAPMACELAHDADAEVEVVPGVTAATSAAALLGAPLGHDFVLISLSDALTPWEAIAARVRAAGEADLVTVFYDPRSGGRPDQLARARRILLEHRKPETPVGIATDAFRPEEEVTLTTLGDLDPTLVGMTTTVVIGSTTTTVVDGRMVTPASYLP